MKKFLKAYRLLSVMHRKRIVPITFLLTINSLLDFFSLASFLPLLLLVITPEAISTNTYFDTLYHAFTFTSYKSFIIAITICILILVLIKNLITAWITRVRANFAYSISSDLAARLINQHFQLNLEKFQQLDYSREANRISSHPVAFANNVVLPATTIFSEALIACLILSGIAVFDYRMITILGVVLLPVLFLYNRNRKDLSSISTILKEKYPSAQKNIYSMLEGFPEIKISAKENFFKSKFKKAHQEFVQALIKSQTLQTDSSRLLEITVGFMICSLVIYVTATGQDSKKILLLLGLCAGATFRIIPSVNRIMLSLQQIKTHEHVIEELNYPPAIPQDQIISKQKTFSFRDKIELKEISFQYTNGALLLDHVSMVIKKGEMVALTGKSGNGKTTLLLILLRLLKETNGHVWIDGQAIQSDQSWGSQIAYVPQHPYILDGTLVENIAFGVEPGLVDRDKINLLIKELDLTALLEQLPHGIDSAIGERGAKLSGGQKQRIAIARALYHDFEILLLDEVTNQVHAELEEEIFSILKRLAHRQKTILAVTHKISSVNLFDKIYQLEGKSLKQIQVN